VACASAGGRGSRHLEVCVLRVSQPHEDDDRFDSIAEVDAVSYVRSEGRGTGRLGTFTFHVSSRWD
jgi:hypothetical protein